MSRPALKWPVRLAILAGLLAGVTTFAQHRWEGFAQQVSVHEERYFMVLAGRSGTFYDRSGPAVSMLIKTTGAQALVDAVGIYAGGNGQAVFGAVPPESYASFMQEPRDASAVLLRLEIAQPEHARAAAILRVWERRAREGALLYPDIAMDNILLVKQVTESLNAPAERFALYLLDWGLEDDISEHNIPSHIPFHYFQELRRLNEGRHVQDGDMPLLLWPEKEQAHGRRDQ